MTLDAPTISCQFQVKLKALKRLNCHSQRSLSEDLDSGTASDDSSKRSFVRQVSKVTSQTVTRKWAAMTVKRKQRWAKHVAQKET